MTDASVIKGPRSIQIFPLRLVVDAVQLHLHLWNPTTIHHNFDHGSRHRARSFNNDAISFRRFLVAARNEQADHSRSSENKIEEIFASKEILQCQPQINCTIVATRSCAIHSHPSEKSNTISGKIEILRKIIEFYWNYFQQNYYFFLLSSCICMYDCAVIRYFPESEVSRFIAVANRDHEYTCRKKHNRFGGTRRRTGDIRRGVAYSSQS